MMFCEFSGFHNAVDILILGDETNMLSQNIRCQIPVTFQNLHLIVMMFFLWFMFISCILLVPEPLILLSFVSIILFEYC